MPSRADVHVDFTGTQSVIQGFCDELVKQLCEVRGAVHVVVVGASDRVAEHIERAARLRGYAEQVTVNAANRA